MTLTPNKLPDNSVPQFWSDWTHAVVIIIVVVAATVAGGLHFIHENTIGNVYTAAIGYAAGRAGNVAQRTLSSRKSDNGNVSTSTDTSG